MKTQISLSLLILMMSINLSKSQSFKYLKSLNDDQTIQTPVLISHSSKNQIENKGNKKIRMDLYPLKDKKDKKSYFHYTAKSIELVIVFSDELLQQSQSIRQESKQKTLKEKNFSVDRAVQMEKQAYTLKIKIIEYYYKLNREEFDSNKVQIQRIIHSLKQDDYLLIVSYDLMQEAEKDMKLAKELREEAYAQPNLLKIYSALSNAEDKQVLALYKQQRVLETLNRANGNANYELIGQVN